MLRSLPRKICIITPGTIASNPRVVKEAEALSQAGYSVHLIYTRHVDFLIEADQEILDSHPEWTFDYLDWAGPSLISKTVRLLSGVKRRGAYLLLKKNLYSFKMAPFLINRFYFWQLNKAVSSKADLYIAHYPDSIGIAAQAAQINNALFAYDAEDYHRGEELPAAIIKVISINEDTLLNKAAYISASSFLIAKAYRILYPNLKVFSIENMFPLKNQPPFVELSAVPIKLFWLSQTVGPKRGLEEFIEILGLCSSSKIQLTLLGNVSNDYRLRLEDRWKAAKLKTSALIFLDTVREKEIFDIASHHHIGLCLEIPYVPNKDLCMSNKLYSYVLSGNHLILSHTQGQNNFHETYPKTGICIDLKKPEESAFQILQLIENETLLNEKRKGNYELGRQKLNFDREKELLLKQIASLWE